MLNKKGMTLLEIIISIALISVVMLFLFSLLNDITYESKHSSYAKDFLVSRATLVKDIEEEIQNNTVTDVKVDKARQEIVISFADNTHITLKVESKKITYTNAAGESEAFSLSSEDEDEVFDISSMNNMEGGKELIYAPRDIDGDGVCDYNCNQEDKNEEWAYQTAFRYCHIRIPVLTGSSDNAIDDLEFFFLIKK